MDKLISVLASPLPFLVLISVVVTVHELGHYWAGRAFGAAAESFSIGFGSSIVERRDRRGTRWRLNWLPLGGFVKFVGELQTPLDTSGKAASPAIIGKRFDELGPWQRLCIALGGPFANFLFAIAVFAGLGMTLGIPEAREVRVAAVLAGSPAEAAGFQVGDVITEAAGAEVRTRSDVIRQTALSAGEPVRYLVLRDGVAISLRATPQERAERSEAFKVVEKIGRVGLSLEERDLSVRRLNPVEAVGHGFAATGDALTGTISVIRRLVSGLDGLDKFSGPVGILGLTDNMTDLHLKQTDVPLGDRIGGLALNMLQLAALLSIGVGFFNLLPIPVLDGGTAVGCIVEGVARRPLPEQLQRLGLTIGLASLVLFALVITWHDITRVGGPLEVISGMLS